MEQKFDFNALADAVKAAKLEGTDFKDFLDVGGSMNPFSTRSPIQNVIDEEKDAVSKTTRGWFIKWLYDHAIFMSMAEKIMDYVIPKVDDEMASMNISHRIDWNGPESGYPETFYRTLAYLHVGKHVYQWAEDNAPQAFWKMLFSGKSLEQLALEAGDGQDVPRHIQFAHEKGWYKPEDVPVVPGEEEWAENVKRGLTEYNNSIAIKYPQLFNNH